MSATSQSISRHTLGIDEFPSPLPTFVARPTHWLDIARPIYRFFAHPLTMAVAWVGVFILSALVAYGWLLVVML